MQRSGEFTVCKRHVDPAASETLSGSQNELFELEITNPSSRPYIELTLDVIRRFGCRIEPNDKSRYHLAHGTLRPPFGGPSAAACSYDCSYAANFVAANALGSEVCLPPPLNGEKNRRILRFANSFSKTISIFPTLRICFRFFAYCPAAKQATRLLQALPAFAEKKATARTQCLNAFVPSEEVPNAAKTTS